jgi:HPt (histidine-containing phosphotransfer) domain-containing protein
VLRWLHEIFSTPTADPAPAPNRPPPPAAMPELLDRRILDEIRSFGGPGHPDPLAEVMEVYFNHTPPRFAEIRDAIGAGDAEALRMAAHTLKSSSASIGAAAVARLAGRMEAIGRAGTVIGAGPLLRELDVLFPQVKRALETYCRSEAS